MGLPSLFADNEFEQNNVLEEKGPELDGLTEDASTLDALDTSQGDIFTGGGHGSTWAWRPGNSTGRKGGDSTHSGNRFIGGEYHPPHRNVVKHTEGRHVYQVLTIRV
ncbi:hypothetical protein JDV02_000809 [Purpureocillium takamizusanense]|uniref:Uncharacterized protein n=1 Tax=Purpureocillium takamizusanense TaxID=2060973 RepID=A0A9Q8Q7Z8_9HYPO|nr:uncharacterized protein JDV02_000809 [Purpureocillium takamizusanense]UNI14146.1 hypothetical protein JDV02_000809 [Purpureocillium takamizusanense]